MPVKPKGCTSMPERNKAREGMPGHCRFSRFIHMLESPKLQISRPGKGLVLNKSWKMKYCRSRILPYKFPFCG